MLYLLYLLSYYFSPLKSSYFLPFLPLYLPIQMSSMTSSLLKPILILIISNPLYLFFFLACQELPFSWHSTLLQFSWHFVLSIFPPVSLFNLFISSHSLVVFIKGILQGWVLSSHCSFSLWKLIYSNSL